jgi:endogenous inhibitor of DNA gyrase (YacG/DUF329 family)
VDPAQVCVFCRKNPVEVAWRPFCSERCKLLDLARWVDGAYRIPAEPLPAADDQEDDEGDR